MIGRIAVWIMTAVVFLAWSSSAWGGGPADFMLVTEVDGKVLEGQPLFWDKRDMCLLCRDGGMRIFEHSAAKNSKKIERSFYPYSLTEMKTRLRREVGHSYAVSSSEHFVVVHPKDSGRGWASRMENLYRSFRNSMRVRGITTREPQVTMVAVIFRNKGDYYTYFARKGSPRPKNTLGHYDQETNRVYLFDDGTPETLETVVHEATHQTAYNVGVHRRLAGQPRWLVEGLAMMFETPGMREAWSIQSRSSRINRYRLEHFKKHLDRRPKDALIRLIASDQPFRTATLDSYAEAWLLSFYLFETRSQDYSRYLARVAARPPFSVYSAQARVADFRSAFGEDLQVLENQLMRFVDEL